MWWFRHGHLDGRACRTVVRVGTHNDGGGYDGAIRADRDS
jgi:hypothetical protein